MSLQRLARCKDAYPFIGVEEPQPGYLAPICCWSCHEDEDLGYALAETDLPDGREAEVCCAILRALDDALRMIDRPPHIS